MFLNPDIHETIVVAIMAYRHNFCGGGGAVLNMPE